MINKGYTMRYDLATNFDPELITDVRKIDTKHQIGTVFGKLRKDIIGGGRASMALPQLSIKTLQNYVDLCHKNDLKFNYLINSACLGNREFGPRTHKKIVKYIDMLCQIGVDGVTVNSPFLCELIRKQFPNLHITIGIGAYVFNCKHIRYWEELGADELTLTHAVNRNFRLLEEMLQFTKNRKISVRIIANNICLHECPYKMSHSSSQAHASQKGSISSNVHIDYNLLSCSTRKVKNPENLISSEWIRPEDVHYYEELCNKVGNNKLTIKLLERTKNTEFLARVVKAYIEESYDGNLLDIVGWPSAKETKEIHKFSIGLGTIFNRFNIKEIKKYYETYNLPNIKIDNKKLEGFMEKFYKDSDCFGKICGRSEDVGNNDNRYCFYCLNWAKKCISYDKEEVDEWIKKSNYVLESLRSSRFFTKNA
ncbi:U32 family peptidase [Clostridium felsineum]|uniref:U32 family peptidase n=1 Tax=Clostridium felsineum TaxID=36839 RepID=UPI00214DA7F8|nr:U32 family peptidase [Clostridium felsineum]MCR3758491.1 U32 family peptidase [Clostridium felsineum]